MTRQDYDAMLASALPLLDAAELAELLEAQAPHFLYGWRIAGTWRYIGQSRKRPSSRGAARQVWRPFSHRTASSPIGSALADSLDAATCYLIAPVASYAELTALEIGLIAHLGREDLGTGPLLNRHRGGNGLSPDMVDIVAAAISARAATPEGKAKRSAATALYWQDPAYVEKVMASRAIAATDPAFRAGRKSRAESLFRTDEHKAKVAAGQAVRAAERQAVPVAERPAFDGMEPGARYGKWSITARAEDMIFQGHPKPAYHVRCDCGRPGLVDGASLRSGHSSGCTPCGRDGMRGEVAPGTRFGSWIVQAIVPGIKSPSDPARRTRCAVICECGTKAQINLQSLKNGRSYRCKFCAAAGYGSK